MQRGNKEERVVHGGYPRMSLSSSNILSRHWRVRILFSRPVFSFTDLELLCSLRPCTVRFVDGGKSLCLQWGQDPLVTRAFASMVWEAMVGRYMLQRISAREPTEWFFCSLEKTVCHFWKWGHMFKSGSLATITSGLGDINAGTPQIG